MLRNGRVMARKTGKQERKENIGENLTLPTLLQKPEDGTGGEGSIFESVCVYSNNFSEYVSSLRKKKLQKPQGYFDKIDF